VTPDASNATHTVTPEQFEEFVSSLNPGTLDELGSSLRELARLRRVQITVDEARSAIQAAPLTKGWLSSGFSDVGRVRVATRILIQRGYHPRQVAEPLRSAWSHIHRSPSKPSLWESPTQWSSRSECPYV
jgi:hypothetical protein